MSLIEKLTPEQEALIPKIRDEWLKIGLATGPCNRAKVELAVDLAYASAGLNPPEKKIWLNSPMAGALASYFLKNCEKVGDQVMAQVWDQVVTQVRDQVWDRVWDRVMTQIWDQVVTQVRVQVMTKVWNQTVTQVMTQIWNQVVTQVEAQVRDQVMTQVMAQVRDQVRDQLMTQVWNQVWDLGRTQVWAQIETQVRAQFGTAAYGQQDAGWLSFYKFFQDSKLSGCEKLNGLFELTECGWWWPFEDLVILTERPTSMFRDEQNRLHRTDGPALLYPDGWALYRWHGITIPEEWVTKPETLTIKAVDEHANAEVRRVAIARYGEERYLKDKQAKLVSEDEFGKLYRVETSENMREPMQMIRVLNSTPEPDGSIKPYYLRVPPTVMTPHDAVAWTFRLDAKDYKPVVET